MIYIDSDNTRNYLFTSFVMINVLFFILFIIFSLIEFVNKKNKQQGLIYLYTSLSVIFIVLKISFNYYDFLIHLIYFISFIIIFFILLIRKYYSKLMVTFICLNAIFIGLSDNYIFRIFNSKNIIWSENFLKWDLYKDNNYEFRNETFHTWYKGSFFSKDSKYVHAITKNGIRYKVNRVNNHNSVIALAFFIPEESSINKHYTKTKYQLNHEKLYVDICEIYVRKIRRVFDNKPLYTINFKQLFKKYNFDYDVLQYFGTIQSDEIQAENFINYIIEAKNEKNSQYLIETNCGKNIKTQKIWDLKIKNELKRLEKYKL